MTNLAAKLLDRVYGVSGPKVHIIPHGVPDIPVDDEGIAKARLQLSGHQVICSFGLINRGKGLEHMIRAMPRIVAACPNAVYVVVGATHPQVKRQEGEVYRESLAAMAETLGVGANVQFVNSFLSLAGLAQYLQACDVFVTPIRERIKLPAVPWPTRCPQGAPRSALPICTRKRSWPKGAASLCRSPIATPSLMRQYDT